jgi:hypothetical protein
MNTRLESALKRVAALWLWAILACVAGGSAWSQDSLPPNFPFGPNFETRFFLGDHDNWQVVSGTWVIKPVDTFVQQSLGAARIAIAVNYPSADFPVMDANFRLDALASIRTADPNARVGVVFNFSDAANYYEASISLSGDVLLRTRRNGVSTVIARATVAALRVGAWTPIHVERGNGTTTVKIDGVPAMQNVPQVGLENGDAGLLTDRSVGAFSFFSVRTASMLGGSEPYIEDFGDASADFWSPLSGTWTAANKDYRNTSVSAADITLGPIPRMLQMEQEREVLYTWKLRMLNRYGGSGNLIGVVLTDPRIFFDPGNYKEVVFSPRGQAYMREFRNGVPFTVATAPYAGGGPNKWFNVEIMQAIQEDGSGIPDSGYVKVNGRLVFNHVFNNDRGIPRGSPLGLVSHWSLAAFDDLKAKKAQFRPVFESFEPPATGQSFALSGEWDIQAETLHSFGIGATDLARLFDWHEFHDFIYRAWMVNHYGAGGNRAGLTYGMRAEDDYYEVVFSPTGTARLNRVFMGFSRTEAAASYSGGEPHRWFNVQMIRRGDFTTVKVNGVTIFNEVYQPGARGEFGGVVTHWTDANFDDISIMELVP